MFNYNDVLKVSREKSDENLKSKLKKNEFRIITEQARYPLSNLNQIFEDQVLKPTYQRNRVWDEKRKSRLIESFLINIPIPPIFLYEIEFSKYEVMDGQQRVTTVLSFLNNEFVLKDLEFFPELEGKKYLELPDTIQNSIKRRYLSASILLKETAQDKEEEILMKQLVFERLNTGGMELNKQEIRNALYSSKFNNMLFELAESKEFKSLWKLKKEAIQRMEDCELVLRFFAYKSAVEHNISKPTYEILDSYMQKAITFKEDDISELKNLFNNTISTIYSVFGTNAFKSEKNKNKREKMIYDTMMLFVSEKLEGNTEDSLNIPNPNEKKYKIIAQNIQVFNGKYTAIRNVKERKNIMNDFFDTVHSDE